MDLFGESITTPQIAVKKSLPNAAHGFPEFWKAWPAGPRKVAKQQCLDKWARYECATQATLIAQHVEWMKTQPDWAKDGGAFICAPLVYLNQRRWVDWEPVAVPTRPAIDPALAKLDADTRNAAPPSEEVRRRMAEITGRMKA